MTGQKERMRVAELVGSLDNLNTDQLTRTKDFEKCSIAVTVMSILYGIPPPLAYLVSVLPPIQEGASSHAHGTGIATVPSRRALVVDWYGWCERSRLGLCLESR